MIVDITGTILIPGNGGKDCPGNGKNTQRECCCDECDYLQCCIEEKYPENCTTCDDPQCPRRTMASDDRLQ